MCRQLRGFVGASWICHEMYLTPDEVMEIYNVDVRDNYRSYDMKGFSKADKTNPYSGADSEEDTDEGLVQIYEIYDKKAGLQYCVADGYDDFLREPMSPDVKIESFPNICPGF